MGGNETEGSHTFNTEYWTVYWAIMVDNGKSLGYRCHFGFVLYKRRQALDSS